MIWHLTMLYTITQGRRIAWKFRWSNSNSKIFEVEDFTSIVGKVEIEHMWLRGSLAWTCVGSKSWNNWAFGRKRKRRKHMSRSLVGKCPPDSWSRRLCSGPCAIHSILRLIPTQWLKQFMQLPSQLHNKVNAFLKLYFQSIVSSTVNFIRQICQKVISCTPQKIQRNKENQI